MSRFAADAPALNSAFSYKEGQLVNVKGYKLFTVAYKPAEKTNAILMFHHGYGEHVGRYKYAFSKWANAGIAVHALDCQSMGKSQPTKMRALVWTLQDLVDDFLLLYEEVRKQHGPEVPVFVSGQSMGGLVALLTVLRDQSRFAGVVLCSPAVDIHWTWIYRLQLLVGQILVWLFPTARVIPSLPIEGISQDPAVIKDALEDPLNVFGPLRAVTGWSIVMGTFFLHRHMQEVYLPMYSHHGTEDRLTSLDGVKKLYKEAKSKDTTLFEVEGGYHELLLGPEKADVVQRITSWIDSEVSKGKE